VGTANVWMQSLMPVQVMVSAWVCFSLCYWLKYSIKLYNIIQMCGLQVTCTAVMRLEVQGK